MRKLAFVTAALLAAGIYFSPLGASSHREAPLISQDPLADNTDVYAFVSPERPDRVVLIANFIPLEFPSWRAELLEVRRQRALRNHGRQHGDAVEDLTYQFRFTTQVANPNTFLYNTGQVTSIDDPDLNVRQFFTRDAKCAGRDGRARVPSSGRTCTSCRRNVGQISMPNYVGDLGSGVHQLVSRRHPGVRRAARRSVLRRPRRDLRSAAAADAQRQDGRRRGRSRQLQRSHDRAGDADLAADAHGHVTVGRVGSRTRRSACGRPPAVRRRRREHPATRYRAATSCRCRGSACRSSTRR